MRLRDALDEYLVTTLTTEGVDEIDPQPYIDIVKRSTEQSERESLEVVQDADEIWNQALAELEED